MDIAKTRYLMKRSVRPKKAAARRSENDETHLSSDFDANRCGGGIWDLRDFVKNAGRICGKIPPPPEVAIQAAI
jgi:hypothetical protein